MDRYDPQQTPRPEEWLELDEQERIDLVAEHHRQAREPGHPGPAEMHAMFHAVVETQLASGEPAEVRKTLERLRREGLDRHDAIHAIGSVLAAHMHHLLISETRHKDPNEAYAVDLRRFDAQAWMRSV